MSHKVLRNKIFESFNKSHGNELQKISWVLPGEIDENAQSACRQRRLLRLTSAVRLVGSEVRFAGNLYFVLGTRLAVNLPGLILIESQCEPNFQCLSCHAYIPGKKTG